MSLYNLPITDKSFHSNQGTPKTIVKNKTAGQTLKVEIQLVHTSSYKTQACTCFLGRRQYATVHGPVPNWIPPIPLLAK